METRCLKIIDEWSTGIDLFRRDVGPDAVDPSFVATLRRSTQCFIRLFEEAAFSKTYEENVKHCKLSGSSVADLLGRPPISDILEEVIQDRNLLWVNVQQRPWQIKVTP